MKHFIIALLISFIGILSLSPADSYAYSVPDSTQDNFNLSGVDADISSTKLKISEYAYEDIDKFIGILYGAQTSNNEVISKGALPQLGSAIAYLTTTPPVQPSTYIADVLQNSGFAVTPAYAQGIGFSALTPILKIWKAFRNIAYFFMIVVFVIIGFMIMFRKQIDQGTIVTIQLALPKIIVTLILITFSYAIAGFIVDLIYLIIFLFTEVLSAFDIIESPAITRNAIFGRNVISIARHYLIGPSDLAGGASKAIAELVEGGTNTNIGQWLTNSLVFLVIIVVISIAAFRTMLMLVSAYVSIVLSVIFAPIQLMFNALPGNNAFGGWIRGLIANAAVFPAVAIMLILGTALVGVDHESTDDNMGIAIQEGLGYRGEGSSGWTPPLMSSTNGLGVSGISGIIGLGIVMLLPEIGKIIKQTLQAESAFEGPLSEFAQKAKQDAAWLNEKTIGKSQNEKFAKGGFIREGLRGVPVTLPGTGGRQHFPFGKKP